MKLRELVLAGATSLSLMSCDSGPRELLITEGNLEANQAKIILESKEGSLAGMYRIELYDSEGDIRLSVRVKGALSDENFVKFNGQEATPLSEYKGKVSEWYSKR